MALLNLGLGSWSGAWKIYDEHSPREGLRSIVVFDGDYIDRGPASRDVLDLLLGCEQTKEAVFLRGNHDTFVHRFMSEPAVLDEWRLWGGLETLVSYGLKPSISPDALEQTQLARHLARSRRSSRWSTCATGFVAA